MDYLVRVDMSTGTVAREKVPPQYAGMGGRSLTSSLVYHEVPVGCDPLGKNNKLVMAPGLLGGTVVSSSGRLSVGAKSPLTGRIKEANAGGTAGGYLARSGIRALVIEGEAAAGRRYILYLGKNQDYRLVEVDFEVKGIYELMKRLREKWGDSISVICAGPAGMNKLRSAAVVVSDPHFNPRFAARGGLGAVMGAKGLQAVVIESPEGQRVPADKSKFVEISRKLNRLLLENPKTGKTFREFGTNAIMKVVSEIGCLPVRNFSQGSYEEVESISGEALRDLIRERGGEGCTGKRCMPGCVICCSNVVPDAEGKAIVANLQYETLALMGANCGFSSIDDIARLNYVCNDIGVDTIEMGAAIGVAMDGGLLSFGDLEGTLKLLEEVREATPLGRIVGNGALITGQVLGVKRIPVSKGQAFPGYDPRALKGNGVTYATSAMGADHTAGNAFGDRATVDPLKTDNQVELSRKLQLRAAVLDTLGFCIFARPPLLADPDIMVDLLNSLYGWDMDSVKLWKMGEELLKLERSFDRREGFGPETDRLPEIFTLEPLPPHNTVFDVAPEEMARVYDFD